MLVHLILPSQLSVSSIHRAGVHFKQGSVFQLQGWSQLREEVFAKHISTPAFLSSLQTSELPYNMNRPLDKKSERNFILHHAFYLVDSSF